MAEPKVVVRTYNVRFGDCFLVSVNHGDRETHALFDFGNTLSSKGIGGANDVFPPVAADLRKRTGGTLDLLVMTHEHLDHMEGFRDQRAIFDKMVVRRVWLSVMSAPDYYTQFPECELQKAKHSLRIEAARRWAEEGRFDALPDPVRAVWTNNVLSLTNADRVQYLRDLPGDDKRVRYLYRGVKKSELKHELGPGVKLAILAPEQNASVYYGGGGNRLVGATARRNGAAKTAARSALGRGLLAPPHMDAGEFDALKDDVAELDQSEILAIDKAANNTSLVVRMTVGKKVLLFTGDAEAESWAIMRDKGLLGPVDLLKVPHHGSPNGLPFRGAASVVDLLLKPAGGTKAIVSTLTGTYGAGTPDPDLMELLRGRCGETIDTQELDAGGFKDLNI